MTFAKRYTQRELDYIRANWETKTTEEMASHLGRSRSGVYKKILDMHLRDDSADEPKAPMDERPKVGSLMHIVDARQGRDSIETAMTDHQRLAGLRDLIWDSMQGAAPADVARLAPEYRKTIQEMIALDGGGKQARAADGGGGGLAEVLRL